MRKIFYLLVAVLFLGATSLRAQLIDEKDVTITMDLQPVLQLDMTTPDQIEFVFDDINEYFAGITHYGATILKVSSTVSWDLYAVGRSSGTNGAGFWDQQIDYGNNNPNAIPKLPLSLLELRQSQANNGASAVGITATYKDYSAAFTPSGTASGSNSLYVNGGTNTPPTSADKYIAGHSGTSGTGDFLPGGSYLTQTGTSSNYYYSLDYRIMPGLPAIFPNAYSADGATAEDIVTSSNSGNVSCAAATVSTYALILC